MSEISDGSGGAEEEVRPPVLAPLYMGENGEHDLYFRMGTPTNTATPSYLASVGYIVGSPGCPALQCYDPETNAEIEPKRFLGPFTSPPTGADLDNAKAAGGWYETLNYSSVNYGYPLRFYVDTHWYTNGAGGGYVTHDEGRNGKSDPWACSTFLSNTEQATNPIWDGGQR